MEIVLLVLQISKHHFHAVSWFWKLYCNCFKYQNTIFMLYPDFGNSVVFASNIKVPFLYRILILADAVIFYVYKNYLTIHRIMLQNFEKAVEVVSYFTPIVHTTAVSISIVTGSLPSYVLEVLTKLPNSNCPSARKQINKPLLNINTIKMYNIAKW